jgi:hypothetical protein
MITDLNDSNFMIFAIKCYDTPNAVMSEFEEDLKRIKYVKRLIRRYKSTGDLKERLILNHIIVLSNVFSVKGAVRMLFHRVEPEYWNILKTFLIYLSYMPTKVDSINSKDIISSDIQVDLKVASALRNIAK